MITTKGWYVQLKKNHPVICFHRERECMAVEIIIVHKVGINDNIADLFTKSLPGWKHVQLKIHIM